MMCAGIVAADSLDDLMRAIHLAETSGQLGPIEGDFVDKKNRLNPRSLGALQISRSYHADAWRGHGNYARVAELAYAKNTFYQFMKRYYPAELRIVITARNHNRTMMIAAETLARAHNGGPRFHRASTDNYWDKIRSYLAR